MALRHSEEFEHRLRPGEARAFLQIHAEREAADTPTVEDLAETLGLSSVEAQAILREARSRVQAPTVSKGWTRRLNLPALIAASVLCLEVGVLTFAYARAENNPANTKVKVHIDSGPRPFATSASVVARMSATPPPDGFMIQLKTGAGTYGADGPSLNTAIEYGQLDSEQAAAVKSRLVASVVDLLQSNVPEAAWNDLGTITLAINIAGSPRTNLVVPVPFSSRGQERETLRGSLEKIVEVAWPQIVRRAP